MPQQIIKRNGKRERFEAYKIQQAIEKAFHASQEEYNPLVYTSVLDAIKGEEYLPVTSLSTAFCTSCSASRLPACIRATRG